METFNGIDLSNVTLANIPCFPYHCTVPAYVKQIKNFYFVHHIKFAFDYLKYPLVPHPFEKYLYPKDFSFQGFYRLFGNSISSQPLNYEQWSKRLNLFNMNFCLEFHGKTSTDLGLALKSGEKQMVEKALRQETTNSNGRKQLPRQFIVSAKSSGYKEIIQLLTNNGYDINTDTFPEAIESKNVEIVRILVDSGTNINLEGSNGWTPLGHAIWNGNKDIVDLLVSNGAKFDAQIEHRFNLSLMELTAIRGYYKVVKKMCGLVYGKKPKNQEDCEKEMFLKLLALARKSKLKHGTSTLKELETWEITKRSQIVTKNIRRWARMYSPFTRACENGNTDLVEFFIKICQPNLESRSRYAMNEKLLINTTAIGIAAAQGHIKIVEILINHGAKINQQLSVRKFSPIFMACMNNRLEIVKFLLENDANIHLTSFDGCTCLMVSVKSEEICKLLIDHGAIVNATDKKGKTALQYAIEENQIEVIKLLQQHGAESMIKFPNEKDAQDFVA